MLQSLNSGITAVAEERNNILNKLAEAMIKK